ncbi:MAG: U32 family peptidase, partial [Mesorhizobium sp.]
LTSRGVQRIRLSPHTCDMVEVAKTYKALVDGKEDPKAARFVLSCLDLPGTLVEGYAQAKPGWQATASV